MIYKKRVVIVNDNDLSNDINSAQSAADSAVLEQHRIYYRSKVGITPHGAALPEVWINNTGNIYNETATVNAADAWTTKITPIARSTDGNEETDKYLFLYTCIQKRTVLGNITYTDILLDETTTVIDGGNIITGSITANRLNARDINASNTLSIGAFDAETREAVSNSTYITYIDGNGIWITPSGSKPTNTQTGAGATGTKIDGTGIGIYLNGTKLAQYGTTTSLYESNGTLAAQLDTEGLILKRGGIKGGTARQNGFVYLSTEDYPKSPGLSINGHTPGTNDPAWREVIGTKFGVDAEGNLYASNAAISGEITATSLIISSGSDSYDGATAINVSGYSIEIVSDSNGVTDTANTTYLYPYLYHNGIEVEYTLSTDTTVNSSKTYYTRSGSMGNYTYTVISNPSGNPSTKQYYEPINYSNFVWYQDDNTTGTPGDANHNGRYLATYGHIYRVLYAFEDGGVGEAVETRIIDSSKYITRINDTGITIHPEITSGNDFLRITSEKIDIVKGNAIVASYGTGITLASNEATVTIGSTSKYHTVLTNSGMYFKNGANTTDKNLLSITGNEIKLYKPNTGTAAVTIDSSGKLTANSATFGGTNGISITSSSVTLGSNCSISWNNVSSKPTILSSSDVTTITENTIKTTNVTAANLTVQAANISGKLSANQIEVSEITTIGSSSGPHLTLTGSNVDFIRQDGTTSGRFELARNQNGQILLYGYTSGQVCTINPNYISGVDADGLSWRLDPGQIVLDTGRITCDYFTYSGFAFNQNVTVSGNITATAAVQCGTYFNSTYTYNNPGGASGTTVQQNTIYIASNGNFIRGNSQSSRKVKHDINLISDELLDPHRLYDIPVVQFVYNENYLENKKDCRYLKLLPGFIAEDINEIYPRAADISEEGEIVGWNEHYIIPPMLALIQEQHKEIEQLKKEVKLLLEEK